MVEQVSYTHRAGSIPVAHTQTHEQRVLGEHKALPLFRGVDTRNNLFPRLDGVARDTGLERLPSTSRKARPSLEAWSYGRRSLPHFSCSTRVLSLER